MSKKPLDICAAQSKAFVDRMVREGQFSDRNSVIVKELERDITATLRRHATLQRNRKPSKQIQLQLAPETGKGR